MTTGRPDLIGGHPLLDLVNTVSWRRDPTRVRDNLSDPAALPRWLGHTGLLTDAELAALTDLDADTLARVRDIRETAYAVLVATANASEPEPEALDALNAVLLDALRHARPVPALPLRWTMPVRTPADLPHRIALGAWELLCSPDVRRLRECAGSACGWLFLDRSRNHTRRWCSTADCGNRDRVRRHYELSRRR
ncbi:CGNR zinc finger domain-containing protein [Pseudonocardia acaciae]|uniref:CGNR zinc finger domain-containing protein n=1 Tax=Pseudonocardia acaciae TaxID=551276 RepID=UPI00048DDAB1|nr:ABATE domain-containing protein [Pseudonocardia acaciae]